MIRWSTEKGFISLPFPDVLSISERPVDREFESHQPHLFPLNPPQSLNMHPALYREL